jgi:GDP-L-fucose synthase
MVTFVYQMKGSELSILITGSGGMLGGSILDAAQHSGLSVLHPLRAELDLRDKAKIENYFNDHDIDTVIHCAARVGGISANIESPADFILENLLIDSNLLTIARDKKVKTLIYFGSSCMYPRDFPQPLREIDILGGPLEPTNESYALAKISAARVVASTAIQDGLSWRVLIPSNLYGPGDNFNPSSSHLVASIINKAIEAKLNELSEIEIWGDGNARREFTFVGDVAKFVIDNLHTISSWSLMMNIGAGVDYSVREYYEKVCEKLNLSVRFTFDKSKPAGMKQKLMSSALAQKIGWNPTTQLDEGLQKTISWRTSVAQNA